MASVNATNVTTGNSLDKGQISVAYDIGSTAPPAGRSFAYATVSTTPDPDPDPFGLPFHHRMASGTVTVTDLPPSTTVSVTVTWYYVDQFGIGRSYATASDTVTTPAFGAPTVTAPTITAQKVAGQPGKVTISYAPAPYPGGGQYEDIAFTRNGVAIASDSSPFTDSAPDGPQTYHATASGENGAGTATASTNSVTVVVVPDSAGVLIS